MKIESLFFELLQVALGKSKSLSKTPSVKEWDALYGMAVKQSLVGICYAGVQQLSDADREDYCGMNEMQYLTWMGMAATIQQRNEAVNRQCVELQQMLSEKGCRSCIFKGQANSVLYHPSLSFLRQPGDIDIWIEGGRKSVIDIVQSIAPTKEIRETHAQLAMFEDTDVEAHYRPGLIRDFFRNNKLQNYFKSCQEECFTNKVAISCGEITAPTQKFNAVHQMLHIYHHLFEGGIGLRQVMDYYYVLQSLPESERDDVMKTLTSLGVKRFAAALMYVLSEIFGMEREKMLCNPNEKDGAFLIEEVMRSGNFGHFDERNQKFDMGSYWQNFFGIIGRNLSYVRFAPFDWLMSPLWRIYHFVWRKVNGYV